MPSEIVTAGGDIDAGLASPRADTDCSFDTASEGSHADRHVGLSQGHHDDTLDHSVAKQPQRAPKFAAIPAHVSDLEFQWDAVCPTRQLGHGSYGRVYLAEINHTRVALKVLGDADDVAAAAAAAHQVDQAPVAIVPERSLIKAGFTVSHFVFQRCF